MIKGLVIMILVLFIIVLIKQNFFNSMKFNSGSMGIRNKEKRNKENNNVSKMGSAVNDRKRELDRILDKIGAKGIKSLSKSERDFLNKETKKK